MARETTSETALAACHCCGLVHRMPQSLGAAHVALCKRCRSAIVQPGDVRQSAARTAAAAAGALLLFLPAILLPILEVEKLGHRHESSILTGIFELYAQREWFVATVVLIFSIVFPITKLVLLLELSLLGLLHRRHKALTYRAVEFIGKWSMMDVLLLAFVVMLFKTGELVHFQFGPAVIAFALCVIMSMVASMSFNPHAIWEESA